MNNRQKVRIEMFKRAAAFGREHAASFAPTATPNGQVIPTRGQQLFNELNTIIAQAEAAHSRQESGVFGAGSTDKGTLRDALYSDLRAITRSVAFLATDRMEPGWLDRFRLPVGGTDEQLIARVLAYAEAVEELHLTDELIALEHEHDFLVLLKERIVEFSGAGSEQSGALQEQTAATAALAAYITRGLMVVRGLNAIANNKFKGSAAMLGAWETARHVERTGERPRVPGGAAAPKLS